MQLKLQRADIVCINQSLFLHVGTFTTDVYIYISFFSFLIFFPFLLFSLFVVILPDHCPLLKHHYVAAARLCPLMC